MKAEQFYKAHQTAPLPHADGSIVISENELFALLEEFAMLKINRVKQQSHSTTTIPNRPDPGTDYEFNFHQHWKDDHPHGDDGGVIKHFRD